MILKKMSLAFLGLLLLISGCGYTTRSMIYSKYKTIYITPFVNKINFENEYATNNKYRIYRPLLETEITRGVIDRYILDGNLKPVDKDSADLVLKGEVMEFRRDPLRYGENDVVSEYRINTVVNITLWDTKENKEVWLENNFTGYYSYFTSGNNSIPESTAVINAIKDLARRIVERTVEQW